MPTRSVILYFNDEDDKKYVKRKRELNQKARDLIYKEVKQDETNKNNG